MSSFEDECVGSSPHSKEGIVVTRIEGEKVYVCDWHVNSHFQGEQVLEKFEEAKHHQNFEFTFSSERELQEDEYIGGVDPILKAQLRKKLKARKGSISGIQKFRNIIQREH